MTQTESIALWLRSGKSLTPIEALQNFQCFRLAARIKECKKMGLDIEMNLVSSQGKKYACYSLKK